MLKAYSEHCQISEIEHYTKIVNSFTSLIIFLKQFILGTLQGSEYGSESIQYCKDSLEIFRSIQNFIKISRVGTKSKK